MTDAEKLLILRPMCGLTAEQLPDSSLTNYLNLAKGIILRRLYPFVTEGFDALEFPSKYDTLQIQVANELIARIGAEGETTHNENGINRSYGDSLISMGFLKQIVPYASTFGSSYTEVAEFFTGDGASTTFVLRHTPIAVLNVTVDGVTTAYVQDDNAIVFYSAPAAGASIIVGYRY